MTQVRKQIRCAVLPRSRGLTLLEIVLALALSATIFVLLGYLAAWQGQLIEGRYRMVTEAQVARVVLDRLAAELRNVAFQVPSDAADAATESGGDVSTGAVNGSADTGGSTSGSTTGNATGGSSTTGGSTSGSDSNTTVTDDLTTSDTVPIVTGIYGTQYQLQIDTQFVPTVSDRILAAQDPAMGLAGPVMTDVLTVMYFVDLPDTAEDANSLGSPSDATNPANPHLLRFALPRAVLNWQAQNGGMGQVWAQATSLAPEVRALECWYYDGQQWATTWDSAVNGALPLAVQVLIWVDADPESTLQPPGQLRDAVATNALDSDAAAHIYSTVVTFPAAAGGPAGGATSSTADSSTSDSGSTSGSNTGGSTTTNTGGGNTGGGNSASGGGTSGGGTPGGGR